MPPESVVLPKPHSRRQIGGREGKEWEKGGERKKERGEGKSRL